MNWDSTVRFKVYRDSGNPALLPDLLCNDIENYDIALQVTIKEHQNDPQYDYIIVKEEEIYRIKRKVKP